MTGWLEKIETPRSPLQHATQPDRKLLIERPIETQLGANIGRLLRCRLVAGDQRSRVAGAEMEDGEDDDGHDPRARARWQGCVAT